MRTININVDPKARGGLWVKGFTDAPPGGAAIPMTVEPDPVTPWRAAILVPDELPAGASGALNLESRAPGFKEFVGRLNLPEPGGTVEFDMEMEPGGNPFGPAPDRSVLLGGKLTMQGLRVTLPRFGTFPWFPCWPWLTQEERANVAQQLVAAGEELTILELPDGPPLYDEPAPNFYTADKFGPLDWTQGNTTIEPAFPALIVELLGYGFKGVWLFLGGDAGQDGVPIAMAQTALLGPVLADHPLGNLHDYTAQCPGWDGVWHKPQPGVGTGWNPNQVRNFSLEARGHGAKHLVFEHGKGYLPVGEGGGDFDPGGNMAGYDVVLGEFDGGDVWTKDTWQILGRMVRPFVRQPEQGGDDPNPPFYLGGVNDQGEPYVYRIFEFNIYDDVRGATAEQTEAERGPFRLMAPEAIID